MTTNACSSCNSYVAGGKCNRFLIVMQDEELRVDECSTLHVKTKKNDSCDWYSSDTENVRHVSIDVVFPVKLEDKLVHLRYMRKWIQDKPRIQKVIAFIESSKQAHQDA